MKKAIVPLLNARVRMTLSGFDQHRAALVADAVWVGQEFPQTSIFDAALESLKQVGFNPAETDKLRSAGFVLSDPGPAATATSSTTVTASPVQRLDKLNRLLSLSGRTEIQAANRPELEHNIIHESIYVIRDAVSASQTERQNFFSTAIPALFAARIRLALSGDYEQARLLVKDANWVSREYPDSHFSSLAKKTIAYIKAPEIQREILLAEAESRKFESGPVNPIQQVSAQADAPIPGGPPLLTPPPPAPAVGSETVVSDPLPIPIIPQATPAPYVVETPVTVPGMAPRCPNLHHWLGPPLPNPCSCYRCQFKRLQIYWSESYYGCPDKWRSRPLGEALNRTMAVNIRSGRQAGELTFFDGDFDANSSTLTATAVIKLRRAAETMLRTFDSLTIELDPRNPNLAQRRRTAVINQIRAWQLPVEESRVRIGISNHSLTAAEALLINESMIQQTRTGRPRSRISISQDSSSQDQ